MQKRGSWPSKGRSRAPCIPCITAPGPLKLGRGACCNHPSHSVGSPLIRLCIPFPAMHPTPHPQAYSNVLRRMLEAAGRGMWKADAKTLEQLKALYSEMDEELEGVTGKGAAARKAK